MHSGCVRCQRLIAHGGLTRSPGRLLRTAPCGVPVTLQLVHQACAGGVSESRISYSLELYSNAL